MREISHGLIPGEMEEQWLIYMAGREWRDEGKEPDCAEASSKTLPLQGWGHGFIPWVCPHLHSLTPPIHTPHISHATCTYTTHLHITLITIFINLHTMHSTLPHIHHIPTHTCTHTTLTTTFIHIHNTLSHTYVSHTRTYTHHKYTLIHMHTRTHHVQSALQVAQPLSTCLPWSAQS